MKRERHQRSAISSPGIVFAAMIFASMLAAPVLGQMPKALDSPTAEQQTFATPEEAVATLSSAVAAADKSALQKMFGPALDEISSGDDVADKASYAQFEKRLKKMTNLVKRGDTTVILYVGAENWPFPFPISRSGDRWFFDGNAGLREMFNRRVGANELHTIGVCREYVRAQKEYAGEDRDGDNVLEYAQRVNSSTGAQDGLYWPDTDTTEASPFGSLFASASSEGYTAKSEPQPFHGYIFRILKRQGSAAPGGAYDYVVNGNMIGGFALVAYPAEWGNSGLMTFIVNQQGMVYQKDLGRNTATVAAAMRAYEPDSTWTVAEDN